MLLGTLIRSMRPPFLLLTVVVIILTCSSIHYAGITLDMALVFWAGVAALLAHLAVNMLNEYEDFVSGLDLITDKTPFSGGSGALPQNPKAANKVLWLGLLCLLGVVLIGTGFLVLRGWKLAAIGVLGVFLILTYTRWLNRKPWICLIAPGLGFGPIMLGGASYGLTGQWVATAWCSAWVVFFLVNNLLLLNQIPDVEADRKIGRHHFVIRYGIRSALAIYRWSSLAIGIVVVLGVFWGLLPTSALLLGFVPVLVAQWISIGLRKVSAPDKMRPYLGVNVALCLGIPAVLALIMA